MPLINQQQIPTVELDFMNHDHAEATQLINRLYDTLIEIQDGNNSSTAAVEPLLVEIYEHNEAHFAREEEQMVRVNFPAYGCHQGEHERVLEEFRNILQLWQDDNDIELLLNYVTRTLPDWLRNHIATMDTVTAMFVNRHDLSVA